MIKYRVETYRSEGRTINQDDDMVLLTCERTGQSVTGRRRNFNALVRELDQLTNLPAARARGDE